MNLIFAQMFTDYRKVHLPNVHIYLFYFFISSIFQTILGINKRHTFKNMVFDVAFVIYFSLLRFGCKP